MSTFCTHFGRPRWGCAVCTAEDARLLLSSGRPALALRLLDELPNLIVDQLGYAAALTHDRVALAPRVREGLAGARQRCG
jgi:hypothetical protein